MRSLILVLVLGTAAASLSGCFSQLKPLRGGSAVAPVKAGVTAVAGPAATITQPENPAAKSSQRVAATEEVVYVFPQATEVVTTTTEPSGTVISVVEKIPAGTRKVSLSKQETEQMLGASQQDDSREITAKLASMKPVQFAGIGLMVVAAAMFHPVARAAVGAGKEMQMTVAAVGAALVFAPMLLVGNEKLILVGGLVLIVAVFGLSRLSYYKAKADSR